MTTLNRTQFAVMAFSFTSTMMDNIVPIHGPVMDKIRETLVKNGVNLDESNSSLIDMGFKDYSESPEKLRQNFNMDKIDNIDSTFCVVELADVVESQLWFERHVDEIDQYFNTISVEEALELQRLMNWMGVEIDFSTRRVSKAVGVVQ